jgi:Holliday junction resolvase-like predicted endonuclease
MSNNGRIKGKRGEKAVRMMLAKFGYYIAHQEVQGLAGDDFFAKDTNGKWWSIEVKNCTSWHPKHIGQAKRQATERYWAIQNKLKVGGEESEVMKFLGMDTFEQGDWLVLWHPSNANSKATTWVAFFKSDEGGYTNILSPFKGVIDGSK